MAVYNFKKSESNRERVAWNNANRILQNLDKSTGAPALQVNYNVVTNFKIRY